MKTYAYTIWLNNGQFQPLHPAHGGQVEAANVATAVHLVFKRYTANPRPPVVEDYDQRDMRAGDIVIMTGECWQVVAGGFEQLENIEAAGWTDRP